MVGDYLQNYHQHTSKTETGNQKDTEGGRPKQVDSAGLTCGTATRKSNT